MKYRLQLLMLLPWIGFAPSAAAEFVFPQMGGGQVAQGVVRMKHADITFDGTSIGVHVDDTVAMPQLRPLDEPDEFDPSQPWSVLGGKAYNFQYGWNPGRFDVFPPDGSWIWIEQLSASEGLEVYQRPPASPAYEPLFGTAGSSARWRWSGAMTHNAYAVRNPRLDRYQATYRVYIGDDHSGDPLLGYTSADVTFQFIAAPELVGDYNGSGTVDAADYTVWRDSLGQTGVGLAADGNDDEEVDQLDYDVWKENFGMTISPEIGSAAVGVAVPEPASWWFIAWAVFAGNRNRGRHKRRPQIARFTAIC